MFNYANVENGVVVGTQSSTNEINHPSLIAIDGDVPELRSTYENGIFTAPAPVPPTAIEASESIRQITVVALNQRLSFAERYAVRKTDNMYIEDIYTGLTSRVFVNLDDPDVVQGLGIILNYLTSIDDAQAPENKTVIDEQGRLAELLVDGTELERYNGIL